MLFENTSAKVHNISRLLKSLGCHTGLQVSKPSWILSWLTLFSKILTVPKIGWFCPKINIFRNISWLSMITFFWYFSQSYKVNKVSQFRKFIFQVTKFKKYFFCVKYLFCSCFKVPILLKICPMIYLILYFLHNSTIFQTL